MKMNSCPQSEKVVAYLLGALDAAGKMEFERHLESCAACRRELAVERSVEAEMAGPLDPGYIEARTMARLRLRQSEDTRSFWLRAFRTAVYALSAAITLYVLLPMLFKLPFGALLDLGRYGSAATEILGRLVPANAAFVLIGAGYVLFLAGSVYAVRHTRH